MKVCVQFQNGSQSNIDNVYDMETRNGDFLIRFKVGKSFRIVFYNHKTIKIISIIPN